MDSNPRPFEQGRTFQSTFTAARMNAMQDRIPRIKFNGSGARVSRIANQYFIDIPRRLVPSNSSIVAWPWKVVNTTTGATGQVQINGGDGFVASLNGFVANVNSLPADTAPYPQLSVTGNGVIYGYAIPTTAGVASPLLSLDIYYAGTLPGVDVANPATYFPFQIATITGYATDGDSNVSFAVNNTYGPAYGPSTLIYCGADNHINVY